jgi:hypothetical protein
MDPTQPPLNRLVGFEGDLGLRRPAAAATRAATAGLGETWRANRRRDWLVSTLGRCSTFGLATGSTAHGYRGCRPAGRV